MPSMLGHVRTQARAEALHSALNKELAVRQEAERVYREWLALKREEKQWQVHEARRSMYQVRARCCCGVVRDGASGSGQLL